MARKGNPTGSCSKGSGERRDILPSQRPTVLSSTGWPDSPGDAGRMYAIFGRTALMRDSNTKPFTYYQLIIQKAIDVWRS
jgi:hypothetical protein